MSLTSEFLSTVGMQIERDYFWMDTAPTDIEFHVFEDELTGHQRDYSLLNGLVNDCFDYYVAERKYLTIDGWANMLNQRRKNGN